MCTLLKNAIGYFKKAQPDVINEDWFNVEGWEGGVFRIHNPIKVQFSIVDISLWIMFYIKTLVLLS